jgi:hypothetical protein
MPRRRRHRIFRVLCVIGTLAVVESASTADKYTVIDVATLESARGGIVRGMNVAGELIGSFRSGSGKRGFRISALERLDSPTRGNRLDGFVGSDGSTANAINALGAVAGTSRHRRWSSGISVDALGGQPRSRHLAGGRRQRSMGHQPAQ